VGSKRLGSGPIWASYQRVVPPCVEEDADHAAAGVRGVLANRVLLGTVQDRQHVRWRLMFVEQGRFKPEPEQQVELSAHAEPFSCGDGERGKADIWAAVGGAILGHGADASRPPDRTVVSHRGGASFGVRSLRSECRIGRGGRGTRPRA